ncbi:3-hydroxyacyl-CoA dehydrogenase NAD-binding domain-containing protein [Aureimonas glaciei]|nr:3-hydroxyacyl-CoA dehydrogenase NAD-binding domain-containing protein [Aureimonas glaciei]
MDRTDTEVSLDIDGGIAVVTVDSPPVNALSQVVRAGLVNAFEAARRDPAVEAVVLVCAGKTFIAGADITEFGKPPQAPSLAEVQAAIEAMDRPVTAAIHGTALGGGLELALACHFRVAVPSAKLGLPEVKLGLLPGGGGTQRLPRLVGAARALEMILSGTPIGAAAAKAAGLIDAVLPDEDLRAGALAFARSIVAEDAPRNRTRDRTDWTDRDRGDETIFAAAEKAHGRKFRGTSQLGHVVAAVRGSLELPFEEGLALERKLFAELVASPQSAAMRHVFFAERQAGKVPGLKAGTPTLSVETVGVIGAGTMGGGIAMNFLNAGLPVTLVETTQAALDRGMATIRANYEGSVQRGRMSETDAAARLALLSGALDMEALAGCDLVVEAVFETMAVKQAVFSRLDAVAKPGAILATNTSYLDVDAIAALANWPEHVLGLHFFSPANVMKLLEVVRGAKTAPAVIATAMQLAKRIGKTAVVVGVCHGFVGNRMLAQRKLQADALLLEGAMPWDVDRVLTDFGLPMGPFAMSDLAGLDLGWSAETSKGETVREILCERGRRGQKTGAGFYDYDAARKATPSADVEALILEVSARDGYVRRSVSDQEILERCLYPMINEGAKILDEGIAARASDIDIVWIHGYGWPAYTGGPMYYADRLGLGTVLAGLRRYEATHGEAFHPAPLLERLVAEGRGFGDL